MQKKNAFSLLELVLALMLLGILSVFAFRYIGVFYDNFATTKSLYDQQMDMDRTLLILTNQASLCLPKSLLASKKNTISYLMPNQWYDANETVFECATKALHLQRGHFNEDTYKAPKNRQPRWVGYHPIGTLVFKPESTEKQDKNTTQLTSKVYDFFETRQSNLAPVNAILNSALNPKNRKKAYITLNFQNPKHRQALGFYNWSSADVFEVKCPSKNCFSQIYLQMPKQDWERFQNIALIKKNIEDRKKEFEFHLLDDALALRLQDGNLTLHKGFAPWQKLTPIKNRTKPLHYNQTPPYVLLQNIKSAKYMTQGNQLHFALCNSDNLCKNTTVDLMY